MEENGWPRQTGWTAGNCRQPGSARGIATGPETASGPKQRRTADGPRIVVPTPLPPRLRPVGTTAAGGNNSGGLKSQPRALKSSEFGRRIETNRHLVQVGKNRNRSDWK